MNENKVSENRVLYIPVNTPDSDDYISGIGQWEVIMIAISTFISIVIGIVIFSVSGNSIFAVIFASIVISSTLAIVRRDVYKENLMKKVKIVYLYLKAQKQYGYQFHNIYECSLSKGEEEVWK